MNVFRFLIPCGLHRGDEQGVDRIETSCWSGPLRQDNNNYINSDNENIENVNDNNDDDDDDDDDGNIRMTHRMGASASSNVAAVGGDPIQAARLSSSGNNTDQFCIGVRERKKKVTGFATLRKKFIRRRRTSKVCDHGRVIRELVSSWSPLEINGLLDEYEALAALKDLHVQAELARPPATTFKQDLSTLYDYKYCTDIDLVYRGTCFPVHRALLSARCPYFRELLAGCPGYGARICLDLRTQNLDVHIFSNLLRYLYTGDICTHDTTIDINILRRISEEFGTPNNLENDLRYLLDTGDYADAALVFTSDGDYQRPDSGSSEYGFRPKLELPCHKAILSARSTFFRNLIQRRTKTGEDHTERSLHIPTRIVLDESVIPKRYARVLLNALYLDTVDLSLILRGSGCGNSAGSLSEVQALTHTGKMRPSPLEEAMELYQIGRFLELDILSQGCEDLILEWLSHESLSIVLRWSKQPHGSAWVHRQALHYLREEFQTITNSLLFYQIDHVHLVDVLKSNFLQASELEVLQAVLKWGEHELVRRMEDREPNILSHTVHSVARKGIKKRDLCDIELREILSELLQLVRVDHILPSNSEILTQAIRRGLVSTPPSHMIGDERENLRINAWIRGGKRNGLFVRPRLFMPYYEEIKGLVEEHTIQEIESVRLRRARYIHDIPDTLYMVDEKPRSRGTVGVDVLAAALPVPDSMTMTAMLKREQKLRQSPSCQRATSLSLSCRHEINCQIRLRVVREFNLPDAVADLLENAACYGNADHEENINDIENMETINTSNINLNTNPTVPVCYNNRNITFSRTNSSYGLRHELPAVVTEGSDNYRLPDEEQDNNSCGESHLSGIMPDVAMATASFGALQLVEQQELELDLGDGTSHLLQHVNNTNGNGNVNNIGPNHPLLQHHQQRSRHFSGRPPTSYVYHRSSNGLPRFI